MVSVGDNSYADKEALPNAWAYERFWQQAGIHSVPAVVVGQLQKEYERTAAIKAKFAEALIGSVVAEL